MNSSSSILATSFADLRAAGFSKKGTVWCRRRDETVFSFEIQKSQFDDRWFVTVGVWFLSLGEAAHLPPHRCHLYGRFGGPELEAALDFETALADRERILQGFKTDELLPLASRCSTVPGVVGVLRAGALRAPLVRPEASSILELDR